MSFRLKTILGIALIEGILLLMLIWMGLDLIHESQESELEKRASAIATLFATSTKDAVLSSDLATLDSFTEEVMKNPGLVYARVLDQDGLVMVEKGDSVALKYPFKADMSAHDAEKIDDIFDTYAEIFESGIVYGQVQIGLSVSEIQELLDKAQSNAFILALLEMCLVALFSFVLGSWLTRQIKELEVGAQRIESGELGHQVKVRGHDELAKTTTAFNAMSLQVKQLYNQLSDTNKELEEQNTDLSEINVRLEHSEKYLASVFNTMADGLIVIDEKGLIRDFNPASESIFGYAHDEVIGCNVSMLMPEPHRSQHDAYMNHYHKTGEEKVIGLGREVKGLRKDGGEFPMELTISESESDGIHKNYTGIVRDISERKQAENELELQHLQLETIQRAQDGFISSGDPVEFFEGLLPGILELSESEYGLIGEARVDENGKPYLKAYALTNLAWDEATRKFYEESAPQGLEFYSLDNLFGKVILDGKPVISNDAPHDPHAKGIPPGHPPLNAFLGLPVYLGEQLMGMVGVANRAGGYNEEVIERLQPILSTCAQLFDALGKERLRQETMEQLQQEVTARKRAQAELKNLNETLENRISDRTNDLQRLYLVSSILSNIETPLDEIFDAILNSVLSFLSETEETCARITFDDNSFQTVNFQDGQRKETAPITINGEQRGMIEIIMLGETTPVSKKLSDFCSLLDALSHDISSAIEYKLSQEERQNMEVQLRHAQKLESVGQLAAGIAHEINTPAQFVNDNTHFLHDAFADYSQLLQAYEQLVEQGADGAISAAQLDELKALIEELDIDYLKSEIPHAITQALDGLQRISKIVQAMKEFSHPGSEEKIPTDINRAIETTIDVSRNEWKYCSELIAELDPALPQVPVLPGEFNQVILNMIVNAAHSIEDVIKESGGMGEIRITTRQNNGWAEIRVSDSGTGIPESIKKRIFDPFYTTKEVGKGSGQGLAISWSVIVDKHDGSIEVEAEEGKGSTFIVRLPIYPPQQPAGLIKRNGLETGENDGVV